MLFKWENTEFHSKKTLCPASVSPFLYTWREPGKAPLQQLLQAVLNLWSKFPKWELFSLATLVQFVRGDRVAIVETVGTAMKSTIVRAGSMYC